MLEWVARTKACTRPCPHVQGIDRHQLCHFPLHVCWHVAAMLMLSACRRPGVQLVFLCACVLQTYAFWVGLVCLWFLCALASSSKALFVGLQKAWFVAYVRDACCMIAMLLTLKQFSPRVARCSEAHVLAACRRPGVQLVFLCACVLQTYAFWVGLVRLWFLSALASSIKVHFVGLQKAWFVANVRDAC